VKVAPGGWREDSVAFFSLVKIMGADKQPSRASGRAGKLVLFWLLRGGFTRKKTYIL
jgi:hypothetical protein